MPSLKKVLALLPDRRASAILLLSGCNLVLLQWVMMRELTALLLGTELVALFVMLSIFIGYSVGYLASRRVSDRTLKTFAAFTLPLHLALPIMYRLLISSLDSVGEYRIGYILLLAITPFVVSAFYSMFLPRFINATGSLATFYGLELTGAALGVILLRLIAVHYLLTIYIPYTLILIAILGLLGLSRRAVVGLAVIGVIWLTILPTLDSLSNAYVYANLQDVPNAVSLASVYSPYQKVDVLQDSEGHLYLFLNGLMDYGSSDLVWFNVLLSEIPAQLVHPAQMAVVGSGSMSSVAFASPYAGHVTTVEIDGAVAELSQRYFGALNHLDTVPNWTLVIDDAKHFFGGSTARYDLIAMDVPAPYTIQEATLHSVEYYALLKQHLTPSGVVSVSLSSTFATSRSLAKRVTAGLLANFKEVLVVTSSSADLSFAYASDALPFDSDALEKVLRADGENEFIIYPPQAVRSEVADTKPVSVDDMRVVWDLSLSRLRRLLGNP